MTNEIEIPVGIPYDRIVWDDIESNPLGTAGRFNGFILGDASSLIDSEGAFALEGNFSSERVFSAAFGREGRQNDVPLSPYAARYIVGGNTNVSGPLNVYGNVVSGSNSFSVGRGSSYFIGKNGSPEQANELEALYSSESGLPGWSVSDENGYYLISSYDTPRFIPASRIGAELPKFFSDAKTSLLSASEKLSTLAKRCGRSALPTAMLIGTDPDMNVFELDYTASSLIADSIRVSVPDGSTVLINIRTAREVTISAPVIGTSGLENRTLICFPDAEKISVTYPSVFYGSLLAPKAAFLAATTGGHINGTAVLASLSVQEESGFELHWYPFCGNIRECRIEEPPEIPEFPEHPPKDECVRPPCSECCTPPESSDKPSECGLLEGSICSCSVHCLTPRINVRLIDCDTGEIIWHEQLRGRKFFLFDLQPEHSYKLLVFTPHGCRPHISFTKVGISHISIEYR